MTHRKAFFGEGCGRIVLDNLECTGEESSLLDCSHNRVFTHNCGHQDDAGVTCKHAIMPLHIPYMLQYVIILDVHTEL